MPDPRLPQPVEFNGSYLRRLVTRLTEAMREAKPAGGWKDLLASISSGKVAGANVPTWSTLRNGISAYAFSATATNEVWLSLHIPHDVDMVAAQSSGIYPHVHWTTAGTNTGVVRWGLEYTFARGYAVSAFGASSTIYLEQAATGTAYTHMITETTDSAALKIATLEPDMLMLIRAFRDGGHANDTCTDAAFGLFVDLHYPCDGLETIERNRNSSAANAWTKRQTLW